MKPDTAVILGLVWMATVSMAGTIYLIGVDKPYAAIGALTPTIIGGLLMYVGLKKQDPPETK